MPEPSPLELTPRQVSVLNELLKAGFAPVMFERFARYIGVEKQGFVALLDPADGKLTVFGQVGYRMGEGIGMLVERTEGKTFVWKQNSVKATPELLAGYTRVREELDAALKAI